MMREIGCKSIDDLFAPIPAEYRLNRDLKVPRQMAESEIIDYFHARADNAAAGYALFLGAGAYHHYRPVVIDAMVSRGEFLTSYTPYQAEIAQGTLQAIFEFQTMICELTGMEVANASMYDGSTGAAEAMLMAVRITGRKAAVVARSVHPEYREVMHTYTQHQGLPITECDYLENGRVDMADMEKKITSDTACVLIQSPNFFGTIEDVAAVADLVHKKGALLIVSIAEALSLGIVKPPWKPILFPWRRNHSACRWDMAGLCGSDGDERKICPADTRRLVGETKDKDGKRGFVLTLSTREQHIRREKATSNICTNQALIATMATIYLTIYGREGLKELAAQNLAKATYARNEFAKKGKILFEGAPRFNEFVVQTKDDPHAINKRLLEKKMIGGFPLSWHYPELGNASLWCCTELNSKEQIDAAAQAVGQ